MNDKPIHKMTLEEYCLMTFEEYYLFQLPTAKQYAPDQPESFYRRQALCNFENIQNIKRDRIRR